MVKIVQKTVNSCVGCPPEMGCMGKGCPNHPHTISEEILICDACGKEVEELERAPWQKEESWVCAECLENEEKRLGKMGERCANCGISNVPLFVGLDGRKHCADCAGMLLPEKEEEKKEGEEDGAGQK